MNNSFRLHVTDKREKCFTNRIIHVQNQDDLSDHGKLQNTF